ncbi:MAG TPA: hypothetical protein VGK91_07550 [Candidatus Udaeobacter sp.]
MNITLLQRPLFYGGGHNMWRRKSYLLTGRVILSEAKQSRIFTVAT